MIMSLMRLCWNSTQKGSLQRKDPFKSVPRWHSLSFGGNKTFLRREAQRRETFQHRLGICQCDPKRETQIIAHIWITRAFYHSREHESRSSMRQQCQQPETGSRTPCTRYFGSGQSPRRPTRPCDNGGTERGHSSMCWTKMKSFRHPQSTQHKPAYQKRIVAMTACNTTHSRHCRNRWRNWRRCQVDNTFAVWSRAGNALRGAFTD